MTTSKQALEDWYREEGVEPPVDGIGPASRGPALPVDWDGTVTVADCTQVWQAGTTYPAGATVQVDDTAQARAVATLWVRSGLARPNVKAAVKK